MIKCIECDKEFLTKDACNAHQRVHSKTLNFELYHQRLSQLSKQNADKKREIAIQKYEQNPKYCLFCSKKILYELRLNKFCNHHCAATYSNKQRQPMTDEQKIKTSSKVKKFYEDNPDVGVQRGIRQRQKHQLLIDNNIIKIRKCQCCGIKINKQNKYNYCRTCWVKSDEFQEKMAHFQKYEKQYVFNPWMNKNVYLQSKLEFQYFQYLSQNNIEWIRPEPLVYYKQDRSHLYFCDFYLVKEEKYIEIKGYMWPQDHEKIRLIQEQYPMIKYEILFRKDIKNLLEGKLTRR